MLEWEETQFMYTEMLQVFFVVLFSTLKRKYCHKMKKSYSKIKIVCRG